MGSSDAAGGHGAGMSPPAPRLALANVSKRFPGVQANDRISLTVAPGEIHAVLGENGAGKSTLMKIIYGVRPDNGTMRWNGAPVVIHNPRQARWLGIAMVFQHFALFETLTVAENVWLGLDRRITRVDTARDVERVSALYGLDLDPEAPVATMSASQVNDISPTFTRNGLVRRSTPVTSSVRMSVPKRAACSRNRAMSAGPSMPSGKPG